MYWYHLALTIGAIIAMMISWNVPRAWLWIALGAISFVSSSLWWEAGWPYPAAFGGATNLVICAAIYALAEKRWELRVWNCFHLMIVIDILRLSGFIPSHYAFAVALEICNWLALFLIIIAGITGRGYVRDFDFTIARRFVGGLNRSLHKKRKAAPFWKQP